MFDDEQHDSMEMNKKIKIKKTRKTCNDIPYNKNKSL